MPRGSMSSEAVVLAGSWSGLVFWRPASVYLHSVSFLDQNVPFFSIGDVKTGWFIIRYRRFTLDSPEIPFSMKMGISVVNSRQSGVNRGSIASQDPLAPSPKEMIVICCIHSDTPQCAAVGRGPWDPGWRPPADSVRTRREPCVCGFRWSHYEGERARSQRTDTGLVGPWAGGTQLC